jgi:hypothetical protein
VDDYSKEPYVYDLIQTKARFDADVGASVN